MSIPPIQSDQVSAVTDPAELSRIEQFLFHEAALLDAWDLERWLELMHADVRYRVPAPGWEDGDPHLSLQIIHDDYQLLAGRVGRLKSRHAHAESPKSRTRRMLSNVRADYCADGDGTRILAHSNFHVLRSRLGRLDHFVGSYRHLLVPQPAGSPDAGGSYRILERLAVLDHDLVEAGGTVSIVL
jgi:p-cumate 2,3-dioxygenase beta subunit